MGNKGEGLELQEGMTFTIEPMINLGTYHSKVLNDGWTVVKRMENFQLNGSIQLLLQVAAMRFLLWENKI